MLSIRLNSVVRITNVVKVLFFTFLILFVSNAYAYSTSVSPNPGYENENFTFTVNLNSSLPSGYSLKISLQGSDGNWLSNNTMNTDSNRQTFTYNRAITTAGTDRKYRFGFFKDSNDSLQIVDGRDWTEAIYTVSKKEQIVIPAPVIIPSVTSLNYSSATGYAGKEFTFYANLSNPLPGGYGLKADFGNGFTADLYGNGTSYSITRVINEAGTNRTYTVAVFDNYGNNTGYQSSSYYTANSEPVQISVPSVTSLNYSSATGYAGKEFTFYANLSNPLPGGYGLKADFGNGFTADLYGNGTSYSITRVINEAGTNRTYTVAVFDNYGNNTGYQSSSYYTANQEPAPVVNTVQSPVDLTLIPVTKPDDKPVASGTTVIPATIQFINNDPIQDNIKAICDKQHPQNGTGSLDPNKRTVEFDQCVKNLNAPKSRFQLALEYFYSAYTKEILNTATGTQKSLSIVFDFNSTGADKTENLFRASYQIPLGTLKTIYGASSAFVYGYAKEEIDKVNTSIENFAKSNFDELPTDQKEKIITSIQELNNLINSNSEIKASVDVLNFVKLPQYKSLKFLTKGAYVSNKKPNLKTGTIKKSTSLDSILKYMTTEVKDEIFYKVKSSGKEYYYLSKKSADSSLLSIVSNVDTVIQTRVEEIAKKGDLKGIKTEALSDLFFESLGYEKIDMNYAGNKGIDGLYVKYTNIDKTEFADMITVESKQRGKDGIIKANPNDNNTGLPAQMTEDWIKKSIQKNNSNNTNNILKFWNSCKDCSKFIFAVDKNKSEINLIKLKR